MKKHASVVLGSALCLTLSLGGVCALADVAPGDSSPQATSSASETLLAQGQGHFDSKDYEQALECFLGAAESGDLDAYSWVGRCYYQGKGTETNTAEAARWFALGCVAGDAHCYTWMGKCFFHGEGVREDYEQAAKWFQLAADERDAYGYSQIARMLYYGWGVEQDYKKALEYNLLAWEQGGYTYVLPMIADAYYNGWGTDVDHEEAVKWYQLGVDEDKSGLRWGSVLGLGRCYLNGEGVEQDSEKARELLKDVVENGGDAEKEAAQALLSQLG